MYQQKGPMRWLRSNEQYVEGNGTLKISEPQTPTEAAVVDVTFILKQWYPETQLDSSKAPQDMKVGNLNHGRTWALDLP